MEKCHEKKIRQERHREKYTPELDKRKTKENIKWKKFWPCWHTFKKILEIETSEE